MTQFQAPNPQRRAPESQELQSHLQKMRRRLSAKPAPGTMAITPDLDTDTDPREISINIMMIFDLLRRRAWLVLPLAAAFGLLTYQWSRSRPKQYKANTIVEVVASAPKVFTDIRDVLNYRFQLRRFYATQRVILNSDEIAQRALSTRPWILRSAGFYGLDRVQDPKKRAEKIQKLRPNASQILKAKTSIAPIRKSSLFRITVKDTDPHRAKELTLALAQAYQEYNRLFRLRTTLNAYKEIKRRLEDYQNKSKKLRQHLMSFREKHNILTTSLDDRRNLAFKQLEALNQRMIKVILKRIELESQLRPFMRKKRDKNPLANSFAPVLENALVARLKENYSKLLLKRESLQSKYRAKHHRVLKIDRQLKQLRSLLINHIKMIQQSYKEQLSSVKHEERTLRYKVRAAKRKLQKLDGLNLNFDQLKQRQKALDRSLETLNKRYFELQLLKDSITTNVRIVERPRLPEKPFAPRVMRNTFIGTMLSFFALIGVFLLIELMDNSIRSIEDIELKCRVSPIGEMPLLSQKKTASGKEPLYNPDRPLTQLEEAIRAVRTNILFMSSDGNLNKLLFTSPSPREGKTFLVSNLSIGFGHAGKKTILIDMDMRRPRVHKIMDLDYDRSKGVSTVIIGRHTIDEALIKTEYPNLDILPCGPIPPSPTELIETDGFMRMLSELEERYDLVLFNTPPTLNVADTAVLSKYVDGCILVASSASTNWNALHATARRIESVGGNVLGAILNKFQPRHRRNYYYAKYQGYYRASYRYYNSDPDDENLTT